MRKRTTYSAEFKAKVVLELLQEGLTLSELAAKHSISPVVISRWKQEFLEKSAGVFKKGASEAEKEVEQQKHHIANLERKVGQLSYEVDWLKKKSDEILGPGWEGRSNYAGRKKHKP
jgi:putative transposase